MERAFSSGAEKQCKAEFSRMTIDVLQFFSPLRPSRKARAIPLASNHPRSFRGAPPISGLPEIGV
jgi:hypothetical protein